MPVRHRFFLNFFPFKFFQMKNSKFQLCLLALTIGCFIVLNGCNKEGITPSVNEEVVTVQNGGTVSDAVTTRAKGPSANGQGFLKVGYLEGSQTFSFHANTDGNGNVTGSWQSNWQSENPGLGGKFHGTIDCLNILADGKTARMSGIVTHVTGDCCPYFGFETEVGGIIWFEVQDNGEGANATEDTFSDWFFFGDFPTTCADDWDAILFPIENGNIQVKP
jgi:hypothetical protein